MWSASASFASRLIRLRIADDLRCTIRAAFRYGVPRGGL